MIGILALRLRELLQALRKIANAAGQLADRTWGALFADNDFGNGTFRLVAEGSGKLLFQVQLLLIGIIRDGLDFVAHLAACPK